MKIIYFEITDFPELANKIEQEYSRMFISEALNEIGYKSAGFSSRYGLWYIDEYEYTFLVLRWGSKNVR